MYVCSTQFQPEESRAWQTHDIFGHGFGDKKQQQLKLFRTAAAARMVGIIIAVALKEREREKEVAAAAAAGYILASSTCASIAKVLQKICLHTPSPSKRRLAV